MFGKPFRHFLVCHVLIVQFPEFDVPAKFLLGELHVLVYGVHMRRHLDELGLRVEVCEKRLVNPKDCDG